MSTLFLQTLFSVSSLSLHTVLYISSNSFNMCRVTHSVAIGSQCANEKNPIWIFVQKQLVSIYFSLSVSCSMCWFPTMMSYIASFRVFLSIQSYWPSCWRPLKIHLSLSPPLSSLFKHTAVTCLLCPVPPVIWQQPPKVDLIWRGLPSSPLPPCVSLSPSSSCCSCLRPSPGEALGQGLWREEPAAGYGAEAGPAWRSVKLRSVRNTLRQERNTWTARTGSWPPWCRTGPKIFTTYCWPEIRFRYVCFIFVRAKWRDSFLCVQCIQSILCMPARASYSDSQSSCWYHEHLCTIYLQQRSKTHLSALCACVSLCLCVAS